ncbi:MAG: IMS domain-containing protein [Phormidesmis sp.]
MAGDTTVRIPLDYYRILGLPIQATAEQLKQSHRDRMLQVPRREYSELAIDTRRQLIDSAYRVLGDSIRRAEYDQEFLATSKGVSRTTLGSAGAEEADANVPTIEIEDHQLVGALLILLELGEYELVLRLGRSYLKRDASTPEGQQLKEQLALPDIILTLAIACLELGREEWQQNHYEHAAESLETGRELLLREDLFPVLRAEIQADLYKLRPYRCLELIARPLAQKQSRQEGITLLRGMLQDRGGIDGAEDDLSGLGVDDFLRFVQQLRGYLTAAEQQEVFEAEAQRPSAVGTYLAVYALLARGFAQHQPALIRRAKQMLLRLSGRQDVHLEQAVCAVLLGQTEEASRALERSQEYEPLAFIREHSQGAPDLLPGLCLYAENWLQQEVFPFFRDLDQAPATLKDYFADSTVQSYLENLPLENERTNRQSAWPSQSASNQSAGGSTVSVGGSTLLQERPSATGITFESPDFDKAGPRSLAGAASIGTTGASGIAEKISQLSPAGRLGDRGEADSPANTASFSHADRGAKGSLREDSPTGGRRSRRGASRSAPNWGRLALVLLAGVVCLGLAAVLARSVISLLSGTGGSPAIEGEPLDIEINEPTIAVEAPDEAAAVAPSDAAGIAEATINEWLAIKRVAYAKGHDTSDLDSVLAGSALSSAQSDLQSAQSDNWYIDYTHGPVTIVSVQPEDATDADQLSVQAQVTESAEVYEGDQRSEQYSYADDVVTVIYDLVREEGQWLIDSVEQP